MYAKWSCEEWFTKDARWYCKWSDFESIDVYFISSTWWVSNITLADRNSFASSTWAWEDASTWSYWYHFQWWNNYGFEPCYYSNPNHESWPYCLTFPWWETVVSYGDDSSKRVDVSWYTPSTYYESSFRSAGVWQRFDWTAGIYGHLWWWNGDNQDNERWLSSSNPITWRAWPCPEWWHVPSVWEWNTLLTNWYNIERNTNLSTSNLNAVSYSGIWTKFAQVFNIPFAGHRISNTYIYDETVWWELKSSTPYINVNGDASYTLIVLTGSVKIGNGDADGYISNADSVRCFSNDNFITPSRTIHTNGWTNAMIIIDTGKVKSLTSPNRDIHSIFEWWYDAETGWNKIETWSIAPSNIYARWSCEEWYTESNDKCVELFTVTYNLSGGVTSWENVTWYTIESDDITLINPTKTWYTFTWRSGTDIDWITWTVIIPTWSTWDRNYEANWEINQYKVTFDSNGWSAVSWQTIEYGKKATKPTNPTKSSNTFQWWTFNWQVFDFNTPITWDITLTAQWKSSWWWGGWWGGWGGWSSSSKSNTGSAWWQTWNQTNSNTGNIASWDDNQQPKNDTWGNIQTWNKISQNNIPTWTNVKDLEIIPVNPSVTHQEWQSYTTEIQEAYKFAKQNWITTMPTIEKANMNWNLTRIAMAKMLSNYAINVLWKKPANITVPNFNDITEKLDADYDNGVTLAYQLWIMWINMPNNNFRPNDEVTRAEFATALSRMLYSTPDGNPYYVTHLAKLVKEWIITKNDPKMKELRGYVMIMLMRSAK